MREVTEGAESASVSSLDLTFLNHVTDAEATSTYLLVIGVQFGLATHRGHVPELEDSDETAG